jgi:hypothetical protein
MKTLFLSIINTTNKQEYSVNKTIYMDKRLSNIHIDFTAMESAYLNLDKTAKLTQTKISSLTHFDMSSNKMNMVPNHKNRAQNTRWKTT